MKNAELYHKTVDILYQAYFNDTLRHYNCYACAVGNLIAANCGYGFKNARTVDPIHSLFWDSREESVYAGDVPAIENDQDMWFNAIGGGEVTYNVLTEKMMVEIKATGYAPKVLALIEEAFEFCEIGETPEEHMFNGLVAVLEVLKEIHEVTDLDLLQANNKRFRDQYAKRSLSQV